MKFLNNLFFSLILIVISVEINSVKSFANEPGNKAKGRTADIILNDYISEDSLDTRLRLIEELKRISRDKNISTWKAILTSSRRSETENAILSHLALLEDSRTITAIAKKLRVPRQEVRIKAAQILSEIGNDTMFPEILPLAFSKNPMDKIYFLEALKYLYDKRFESIVSNMIKDKFKSIKIYALKCAVDNEIKDLIPVIRKEIINSDNNEFLVNGLKALIELNDRNARSAIRKTMKSDSQEVRGASIKAAEKLRIHLSPYFISSILSRETVRDNKLELIELLIYDRSKAGGESLTKTIASEKDPVVQSQAIHALAQSGSRYQSNLKEMISHHNFRVRAQACHSYVSSSKTISLSLINNILKNDKSRFVKSACLYSMLENKPKDLEDMLYEIYVFEKDVLYRDMLRKAIMKTAGE